MSKHENQLKGLLLRTNWAENDILRIITSLRHIIENQELQYKYKYLNLYCNWVLHPEISKSTTAFEILELLTDSIIAHNKNPLEGKWLNDAIIEGLSLHKLLEDIINLCKELHFVNVLEDFGNWKKFASMLICELIDKPIKFPKVISNKTIANIYNSIQTKDSDNAVLGISFIIENDKICWRIDTKITIEKNITFIGPMAIINQEMIINYLKFK